MTEIPNLESMKIFEQFAQMKFNCDNKKIINGILQNKLMKGTREGVYAPTIKHYFKP
jgi:hypothetical protein